MTPAHLRRHLIVACGGPHTGQFVGRDRHADASAAQEDAAVDCGVADTSSHVGGDVGIIDRFVTMTSAVDNLMPHPFQQATQTQPRRHTAMIATNCNAHEKLRTAPDGGSDYRRRNAPTILSIRPAKCSRICCAHFR